MSILRPPKEEILDHLRTSVITEAGKRTGFLGTTVPKLNVVRRVQQGQKLSFNEPYLALILQGTKKTYIADKSFTYTAGDIVITNLSLSSRTIVQEASSERPFLSIVLTLDPLILSDVARRYGFDAFEEADSCYGRVSGRQRFSSHVCTDEQPLRERAKRHSVGQTVLRGTHAAASCLRFRQLGVRNSFAGFPCLENHKGDRHPQKRLQREYSNRETGGCL